MKYVVMETGVSCNGNGKGKEEIDGSQWWDKEPHTSHKGPFGMLYWSILQERLLKIYTYIKESKANQQLTSDRKSLKFILNHQAKHMVIRII